MQKAVAFDRILTWLAAEQSATKMDHLVELNRVLDILVSLGVTAEQRLNLLDLFLRRTMRLQAELANELTAATLPLPQDLRLRADRVGRAFGLLAQGFVAVINETQEDPAQGVSLHPTHVAWLAMQSLHGLLQVCVLSCAAPPANLWQQALLTLRLLQAERANASLADEFNHMLALTVVQPESFTARELAFLIDYLQSAPSQVVWLATAEPLPHSAWWIDPAREHPPHATARLRPPQEPGLFFFDCAPLANQARQHLAQLADGTPPAKLGLPPAASDDYRNILTVAADRWSGPGKRQHIRYLGNYRVEVCASAGALWNFLADSEAIEQQGHAPLAASEWLVTNESAGGYTLYHVAGPCAGLRTGAALGLRQADCKSWNICLVRWAKSDHPAHIELGLDLLATTAQAVRIAHHGTNAPVPALLLPPQPTLQRGETLLTTRGLFRPGNFMLLADSAEGVHICDCESGPLVTHTSSIEIFEFSRRSPRAAV